MKKQKIPFILRFFYFYLPDFLLYFIVIPLNFIITGTLQTIYILVYMSWEFLKWLWWHIKYISGIIWWIIGPVARPIIRVVEFILSWVTLPIHYFLMAFIYVLNDIMVLVMFLPKYFIVDFYTFLNKNYQVKARTIAFILRVFWLIAKIWKKAFAPFYFLYMAFFHLNFLDFYVAYPWRPIRFILRITLGVFLRALEVLIDTTDDVLRYMYAKICFYSAKIRYIWHINRRRECRHLLRQRKWRYIHNYLLIRFLVRCLLYIFFSWYFFYFLQINAGEIGPWWGDWSVCSFLYFVTLYLFLFNYYCLRFWQTIKVYFDDYIFFFWCLTCWAWICAQFARPPTWGTASNKILKILIGFWF